MLRWERFDDVRRWQRGPKAYRQTADEAAAKGHLQQEQEKGFLE
jgi:hypothetical protein